MGHGQELPKKAKLRPYKVHAMELLMETDKEKRVWYYQLCRSHLRLKPAILYITWFMAKAWFHLSGNVNSGNSRYWAAVKPYIIKEHHPTSLAFSVQYLQWGSLGFFDINWNWNKAISSLMMQLPHYLKDMWSLRLLDLRSNY